MIHSAIILLFLFFFWIDFGYNADSNEDIPQFWLLPEPEIYEDEMVRDVGIQIIVSPLNTTIMLAYLSLGSAGYSDEMKLLNFGNAALLDYVEVIVESEEIVSSFPNRKKWKLKIVRCSSIFDKSLHVLAKNEFGTLTSRPFRIIRKVLNPFPLVHHESAEFLMGNVGQIVCMIPQSKPSPPHIEFLHDNIVINTTKGGKYKKIYLHPGTMVLLIKNLMPQDAGSYTCTASLQGTKSFQKSDKKTRLTVSAPKENLKPRFRLSSHDNERKDDKVIEVMEGSNITLYCLYESAPVAEVTWYWLNSNKKYEVDPQFGTLSINNVQLEDNASKISCLTNEDHGRSFGMKVIAIPRFTSNPPEIPFQKFVNDMVNISCQVQNNVINSNIKWFHNGKILKEKEANYQFSKTSLIIKSLENKHLGIYQCWLENDGNLWATGFTIIRKTSVPEIDQNSEKDNTSIIERRTSSGLTIHLECSLKKQSQRDSVRDFNVKWFRFKDVQKPIGSQSNKYVMFNMKSERKNILSIVNPTKNQDEGIYICQFYDQQSRLLQTVKYLLIIDDQKSNEANQFQLKSTEIASKKPLISTPVVVKLKEYLFGIDIKWEILSSEKAINFIDHFRVEYQKKLLDDTVLKGSEDKKLEGWSDVFMIDEYPTTNRITITDQQILQPNIALRFRVILILKVLSPIPTSETMNKTLLDSLRSGWSNVVDFSNILNCKLTISKKSMTTTAIEVMWTHTCVRDVDWQQMSFFILYVSTMDCLRSKKCQPDKHLKNYESIFIFPEFKDLQHVIKIDREFGEFFKANITQLKPDSEYMIALYGKQITASHDVFYIPMSSVIRVSTAKVTKSNIQDKTQQNNLSEVDDSRNRIIFLILGSLAGVLFVVAAVMFGMCTWYYMKKHMKIHKVHMKPTNMSQPTCLFHYPPSTPLCYGSRINPLSQYQPSLATTSNMLYYPNHPVGKPSLTSCGNNQNDMWPLNYYSHSPNTMIMTDKFSSDRDSDIDSICNSEKNINNSTRRPIIMGADQASSTYSRIGSERRFSIGAINGLSPDYPNSFQNMTLPRQNIVPLVFPEPPSEPQPDKYSPDYQRSECYNDKINQNMDNIDMDSASIPFLDNNSKNSFLIATDYKKSVNNKLFTDNPWVTDSYFDLHSSNPSIEKESSQLKSMIHAYQ